MRKLLIGREGKQPFAIRNEGVSAIHASLTITSENEWILADEHSTNGTFVKNNEGRFERIETRRIGPSTVIRLGDETVNGITFKASSLMKTNAEDYSQEFRELKQDFETYTLEKQKLRRRASVKKLIPVGVSVICIAATLVPPVCTMETGVQMRIMRLLMLVPPLLTPLIGMSDTKEAEALSERFKHRLVCPKCGKPLKEYEITKGKCAGCHAHC